MATTTHILTKAAILAALDEQAEQYQERYPDLAGAIRETREDVALMPGDFVEKVTFSDLSEDGESEFEGWRYQALGTQAQLEDEE
ncbi:MAG: putative YcjX-like family ATPase [Cognaticolwellia sp.]|jgi:predicted YcjX-like family ATPase